MGGTIAPFQTVPVAQKSNRISQLAEDFILMKDTSLFPPLPRREFLRISATSVAGIAATSLISPTSLFAAGANTPLLAIGYSPSIPGDGQRTLLFSATDILSSDPGFLRSRARVTVSGARHPRL